jgi:hypothetical protein
MVAAAVATGADAGSADAGSVGAAGLAGNSGDETAGASGNGAGAAAWVTAGSGPALGGVADALSAGPDGDEQPTTSNAIPTKVPRSALTAVISLSSVLETSRR